MALVYLTRLGIEMTSKLDFIRLLTHSTIRDPRSDLIPDSQIPDPIRSDRISLLSICIRAGDT